MLGLFQESSYNFMQESQIDIESPHMDPAVVSVSSFAPPLPQQVANQNVYNNSVDNINAGLNDLALSRLNTNTKNDDEIDEWDQGSIPTTTFNNSAGGTAETNGRGM